MSESPISATIEKMVASEVLAAHCFEGCEDSEIAEIESVSGVSLPETYKELLRVLGKNAGDFLCGSDFLYPDLLRVPQWSRELLVSSDSSVVLPKTAFPFLMHQGYQFLFFDCADGHDPPVFRFLEGDEQPTNVSATFSEWLELCAEGEIQSRLNIKASS